jgi:hypothetical protein
MRMLATEPPGSEEAETVKREIDLTKRKDEVKLKKGEEEVDGVRKRMGVGGNSGGQGGHFQNQSHRFRRSTLKLSRITQCVRYGFHFRLSSTWAAKRCRIKSILST